MSAGWSSRDPGGEDGFRVFEVIVAFAVAALGILLTRPTAGEAILGLCHVTELRTKAEESTI